jgi:hypothetical protein
MWGLFTEGIVRKKVRERLGEVLGVPGAQYPIIERLRKGIPIG